jgi:xylan 1,4-beta-xylosidase
MKLSEIVNPILPGFNPDPSIIYAEGFYYIATSTFQWFPGVQIHKSSDLVNWEFVTRPLNNTGQLDMKGIPDSGGIWAPCLSYDKGIFYLIYTNVHSCRGIFKDTPNYLVTASNIEGPWSEPKYLNSLGFDPSLFHDEDGKKYLLNMMWDHRPWMETRFYGITIQEYDFDKNAAIGERKLIFKGTALGCTEGPHMYRKDGYYYLFTAEGGTGLEHCETVARSRNITGPYEVHPQNPLITSRNYPDLTLQKAGHADIIKGHDKNWYLVHLTSRPGESGGHSVLGRETAIQQVVWPENQWPRLSTGGNEPALTLTIPGATERKAADLSTVYSFYGDCLHSDFQFLRSPLGSKYNLKIRRDWIRMYGGESMSSLIDQTLIGVRHDSSVFDVSVTLDYSPESFLHMAGLAAYYDTSSYYYLHISKDEQRGKVLHLQAAKGDKFEYPVFNLVLKEKDPIKLRYRVEKGFVQFYYAYTKDEWIEVGKKLSAEILSDEYGEIYRFTGAFAALACQDLTGQNKSADFTSMKIQRF